MTTAGSAPRPTVSLNLKDLTVDGTPIGGVFEMTFQECLFTTNDARIKEANGLPFGCFLIALPTASGTGEPDYNAGMGRLLRVRGRADLPDEGDLRRVREESTRAQLDTHDNTQPDPLTRSQLQRAGYTADIIGTLIETDDGLTLASDTGSVYAHADFRVVKPSPVAQAILGSFPVDATKGEGVKIGRLRYTSADIDDRLSDAEIRADITDFIGQKVALFGMTRTGKSNTVKTLATATIEHAAVKDMPIGQLLVDPSGEYANANDQDERAIAQLGDDVVRVYSWDATDHTSGREPLKMNFFEENQIKYVWHLIKSQLTRDSDYVDDFKEANPMGPSNPSTGREYSQATRSEWQRSALYAAMVRAGFEPHSKFSHVPNIDSDIADLVVEEVSGSLNTTSKGNPVLDASNIDDFWLAVDDLEDDIEEEVRDDWFDADLRAVLTMLTGSQGSGYKLLRNLRSMHDPDVSGYFGDRIYDDLKTGRVVILDVHNETSAAVQHTVERVIRLIFERAVDRFTSDETPPNIQIYLEEAHRFLNRDYIDDASEDDPYVTLAFEGARNNVGLVYATQQVSNVDPDILSQTYNIFATYLNNDREMQTLSKYDDFAAYERLIRGTQDTGFAVMTTEQRRYPVPVQVDEFTAERVDQAHATLDAAIDQGLLFEGTAETEERDEISEEVHS